MRLKSLSLLFILIQGLCVSAQSPWTESSYREVAFPISTYYVSYFHLLNEGNLDECVSKTLLGVQSMLANSIYSEVSSASHSSISASNIDGNYTENETFVNEFSAAASAQLVNVHLEHCYDKESNTVHAIAYVKKQDLSDFCENKVRSILSSIDGKISDIGSFVKTGYKNEARKLIDEAVKDLNLCPSYFSQLMAIGLAKSDVSDFVRGFESKKSLLLQYQSDMEHSTTIYISATYSSPFVTTEILASKCRGILSSNGCSFVDEEDGADFIIDISYETRTSSKTDAGCFAFSDITLTIKRKRDELVIYNDMISVKGGAGTEEKAHRKAIDLSSKPICENILNCIQ